VSAGGNDHIPTLPAHIQPLSQHRLHAVLDLAAFDTPEEQMPPPTASDLFHGDWQGAMLSFKSSKGSRSVWQVHIYHEDPIHLPCGAADA